MENLNDPLPSLYKKIDAVITNAIASKDYEQMIRELSTIKRWIRADRSLQQHRLYFKFMQYLWNCYGRESSFDLFHAEVKCRVGYAHIDRREIEVDGEKVKIIHTLPKSVAFGKCTQKIFNQVFDRVKEYAAKKWAVVFDLWQTEHDTGASE